MAILSINSCQSCPEEVEQNNLDLAVPAIPEPYIMPIIDSIETGVLIEYEDYKSMLISILDYYTKYFELLLAMEASGQFLQSDIDTEKQYCEYVIDWISVNTE